MGDKAKPLGVGALAALLSLGSSPIWGLAKKPSTGAEQPFDTSVDGHAPVEPPSPSPSITRRRTPAALAVGVHYF
jgi:hypothetical protein